MPSQSPSPSYVPLSMAPNELKRISDSTIGTTCLVLGVALAVIVVAVRLEGLWEMPTGLIRRNPMLMLGIALCLTLGGSRLLWQTREVSTAWSPSQPGRRFHRVVLYTKPACPLCEQAATVLAAYEPFLPAAKTIDIQSDHTLKNQYAGCVPVIEIDGRRRFIGQINEVLLRRLIEGAPPLTETGLSEHTS